MANTSTEVRETRCWAWLIKESVRGVLVCCEQLALSIACCWQEEVAVDNADQADLQRRCGREHLYLLVMFWVNDTAFLGLEKH